MKFRKKENQSVDTLVLLRRENKILKGGNTETKCGEETEGKATQRLPHLGSTPYTDTKSRDYCGYQEVLADRDFI